MHRPPPRHGNAEREWRSERLWLLLSFCHDDRDHRTQAGGAVVVLIIAGIVLSICLILLGLTGDFLVDWLWFSTIGYLGVFWATIAAEGEIFFAVFVATAIILWVNGSIASRIARSPWTRRPADFEWQR